MTDVDYFDRNSFSKIIIDTDISIHFSPYNASTIYSKQIIKNLPYLSKQITEDNFKQSLFSIYYTLPLTMSQDRLLTLFQLSTQLYKDKDYKACLAILNDCLLLKPISTTLYSNRSIANFHLLNLSQTQKDLKKTIEVDHLNHVAYFNLFSLHLTNAELESAFENLCFSLSSLCVKVAKSEKNLTLAQKAIFYSYNNKEALSLKSMLQFEKGRLDVALDFLTQAWQWQINPHFKKSMQKTISWLFKHTKKDKLIYREKFVSGGSFRLLTSLSYTETERKDEVFQDMLQEFNSLYARLLKLNQQQIKLIPQIENQRSSVSKGNQNIGASSEMKEDKMDYKLTTYESKIAQDQHQSKETGSHLQSVGNKSVQPKSEKNTELPDQVENEVETKKPSERQFFINIKIYYAQLLPKLQKNSNTYYVVLKYNNEKNGISITSCQPQSHNFIQWNELSNRFKLSKSVSNLEIKIFNKNFFKLQDDLLGQGQLQINQLGVANVPLMDRQQRHVANVVVGVQHCKK